MIISKILGTKAMKIIFYYLLIFFYRERVYDGNVNLLFVNTCDIEYAFQGGKSQLPQQINVLIINACCWYFLVFPNHQTFHQDSKETRSSTNIHWIREITACKNEGTLIRVREFMNIFNQLLHLFVTVLAFCYLKENVTRVL